MKAAELEALGRRAAACPRWRWIPGMLLLWKLHERGGTYEGRVCHFGDSDSGAGKDVYCEGRGDRFDGVLEVPKCFPDLSDPATLGCLLHLVREAHGDGDTVAFVAHSDGSPKKWCVDVGVDPDFFDERKYVYGRTEAEAFVVALEAAP